MTGTAMSIAGQPHRPRVRPAGPASMAIDTACSSSLVALARWPARAWRADPELEAALVGGVNAAARPLRLHRLLPRRHALADRPLPRLRCRAPTAMCAAEGAGVVVLKRAARRAGAMATQSTRVILAAGVNRRGDSHGLSLPKRRRPAALIARVLRRGRRLAGATSPTSRRTAPAPRWATRPRRKRSARVLGRARANGRCRSARSRSNHRPPRSRAPAWRA